MRIPSPHRLPLILAALLFCAGFAAAQNPVMDGYNKGVGLMQEDKWDAAARTFESVIKDYGVGNPFNTYGPAFGLIHYHLGLCQLKLNKFKEAAGQFETCYKEYPNKIPNDKTDEIPNTRNHYRLTALYQWGRAEQGSEEYAGAIKLYNKFLSEKPEKGTFSMAELLTNMGVCHAKLKKISEATGYLQQVYDAYDKINPREKFLLHKAFFDLCDKWVEGSMTKEAIAFLDKNDGSLRFPPYDAFRYGFAGKFLKLAQECSGGENNLDALALRFFALTPLTGDAVSELEDRKAFFQNQSQKDAVQVEIDKLEKKLTDGTAIDIAALRLLGFIYEKNGSFRAAYSVNDYLARRFPAAKSGDGKKSIHPEFIYNATRCAFSFGDLISAQHHGMTFLKQYPGHELEPEVQGMLMEQLFRRGDYERCIKIATDILPKLTDPSPQHDLCLFCLGGSLYYDGKYEEADPKLVEHAKKYEKSAFLEEASYYHGANKVKMLEWGVAAGILDKWLGKYKDSSLRPFAILDRATCHFAEDELDQTLAKLDEIEQRFPDALIYDRSLNLRGDVLQAKAEYAAAEEAYLKGKSKAEELGNYQVAAEALSQLVPVAIAIEDFGKAATYYDEFTSNYAENYLEPNVVASAMPALVDESVGRGEEGLKKMEDMIDRLGQQENADLEKAVTTYGRFAVELNGAEPTIENLKTMGRKAFQPDAVKAWLLISRIDIIEDELEEGPKATAEINTAFNELQTFDKSKLAPYVLAQTGDFLRNNDKQPQSVPFFEEILSRPGIDAKDYAYNALAKIYFRGAGSDKHTKAMEYVDWVLKNSGNNQLMEESAYELASFHSRSGESSKAEESWFAYVSNKSWRTYSPEAWFRLGEAREKKSNVKGALSAYLQNYAKYAPILDYSIPAIARSAKMQKEAGESKKAYDLAYLAGMKFRTYISDPRFSREWEILRSIYSDFFAEFGDPEKENPYA